MASPEARPTGSFRRSGLLCSIWRAGIGEIRETKDDRAHRVSMPPAAGWAPVLSACGDQRAPPLIEREPLRQGSFSGLTGPSAPQPGQHTPWVTPHEDRG